MLSLRDTNILKGVALLLLLYHHLFFSNTNLYSDWMIGNGHAIVAETSMFAKLCVAIFVFLSGYGLTVSADKNGGVGNIWTFYRKRYVKLMMNYWLIWILFVPFGVFVMGRTFPVVYGGHYLLKAMVDLFGVYEVVFFTPFGYNSTWWFYSCIIVLYALFPLLYKYRDYWFLMIPLCIVSNGVGKDWIILHSCATYSLSFVCGIIATKIKITPPHYKKMAFTTSVVLMILSFYRFKITDVFDTMLWDSVITFALVYSYKHIALHRLVGNLFEKLGKHSFNIFLFHTFFYHYYFSNFIYWSRNPLLIYITLLTICVFTSFLIEKLKVLIYFDVIQKRLIG